MVDRRDVEMVVDACVGLQLKARQRRWAHLSLCVLDAVFSINARYEATVRVCRRYAAAAGLEPVLVAPQEIPITGEQPLPKFLEGAAHDSERFAGEVLGSRQRTSTRSGVLKAEAAGRYAQVLVAAGVHRLGDVAPLLADPARLASVEQDLKGRARPRARRPTVLPVDARWRRRAREARPHGAELAVQGARATRHHAVAAAGHRPAGGRRCRARLHTLGAGPCRLAGPAAALPRLTSQVLVDSS